VQDINTLLGARLPRQEAKGAVEVPQQLSAVPSRRLKNVLLVGIFVLVVGIIGYALLTWEKGEEKDITRPLQDRTDPISRSEPAQGSALIVSGKGTDLYYVYDASGQKHLSIKLTGQLTELLPGTYQVELNKNRVTVQARAKESPIL
jgi:hypothetical protein